MDIKEIQKKLEESEKKAAEYLTGWQRARADFLNYKKEEMARIGEFLKYATEEFILKILPILDNFNVAEKNLPENLKNEKNVRGVLQIKTQLEDFLKSQGVEKIKSLGEKFNPNLHEVVEEIEVKDGKSGIIIEEIQKGYKLYGKVIRPAKIKINK
ncbi:nucleotide exchange factor GrpE [Candidatus Wolfebacteria bacterium CG03_land_8_20_14_0_80_40_12]|uniref:Protein GrpE n=1 Tax=Candidatus Wolfebacteria bacterium CG03_land_8_20_14_0_80_40_12 TaxID=1975069 RepID=A0A2M7B571_9BACT|nr:MAG: nucleotide exchange factor GrpE [Candidatus Wolfebacteria bacterium CG03_land_8_20_14_0_80_40_12]